LKRGILLREFDVDVAVEVITQIGANVNIFDLSVLGHLHKNILRHTTCN
jgi:hypothetical protein